MSHDDLIAVTRRWEKLYAEEKLKFAAMERFYQAAEADYARLRALVSWIDGMLVDESDPMVIREGIYTALEAVDG